MEIWFALVTFVVMNGVNVALVFPEVSCGLASGVSSIIAASMVFIPMRIFSYLSAVASMALAIAAVALVCAALTMDEWANPYEMLGDSALVQLQNVP
eukprot:CAMPEP_0197684112 /NCGR_PEP_ID=MMETSP1338-20131121/99018_1 /TAXON_ID=43686 ORGANISM="Pelagodinium beii, Strain RCC1491" /NCGR_SAMPLE_ID=MMETSP1338 /ASSEMBLY_ACC=CAM_ASM_000754 /LENGTH=96 /DNA_ID=CAMNT_0043265777 /DNA_START=85 /DNA_END=372 /DNA_ORIENTATION=+